MPIALGILSSETSSSAYCFLLVQASMKTVLLVSVEKFTAPCIKVNIF